jgi:hypothetical protein
LANRTRRVAARGIAAIPAESIPFIDVAVLIADTGYELYAAREAVRALDQLYSGLGMGEIESIVEPNCVANDSGGRPGVGTCGVYKSLSSEYQI